MSKKPMVSDDDVSGVQVQVPPAAAEEPEVDWKGKYLRALADYQNLVRRTSAEKETDRKFASQVTIETILPAISLLKTAQEHLKNEGLDLAMKELGAALSRLGVEIIDPLGGSFDPETMECVHAEQGGTVVTSVASPGYLMHGKLIRPAKVVIGKKTGQAGEEGKK